ncbi:MAG TPA: type II toxin-antitoxin system RelE/ParE family toxin [Sulfurospirillum arcachonense]|nr:type II toxin-antitoxin system RelE/ParE family toxin [Sulfurospirillum arcachonense]
MTIVRDIGYKKQLLSILRYIANDKISASIKFEKELDIKIRNLVDFPYKFHASYYFEEKAYRDMTFEGYTIIYKVKGEYILILEIFKWQNR